MLKYVQRRISVFDLLRDILQLVSQDSACLDGHKRLPLDVRHTMMNKFRGSDDGNFKLVAGALKEIILQNPSRLSRPKFESDCIQCLASNYRGDKDRIKPRVPGTCNWFLEHPKFLAWDRGVAPGLLWVSADPGCGKTVLSKALVDEGLLVSRNKERLLCYFFFKNDDTSRQTSANALCAILHQLFSQKPILLRHAIHDFEKNGERLRSMSSTLWDILEVSAADPDAGEIICILDALDECQESDRADMIHHLSRYHESRSATNAKLKFLVTSRPYSDVERSFYERIRSLPSISLRGEHESEKIREEINKVIEYQIPRISCARQYPLHPEVQVSLITYLTNIPHRTYLWLHLVLDVIRKSPSSTINQMEKLTSKIPNTVEDAYEKILERIDDSLNAGRARRILHIIVAAIRPLTLHEMNVALAVDERLQNGEPSQSYYELDLRLEGPLQEEIRDICGLFVSIVGSYVYLIHHTAKEFLIAEGITDKPPPRQIPRARVWGHSLQPGESNLILTRICLSYLLFPELDLDFEGWEPPFEKKTIMRRSKSHGRVTQPSGDWGEIPCFLSYAAGYWGLHFQRAIIGDDAELLQSALEACDPARSGRWFRTHWRIRNGLPHMMPIDPTSLMIASILGLIIVVKHLLEDGAVNVNYIDNHTTRTSLAWASINGHVEVVKLLLNKSDIELDVRDAWGLTPLTMAVLSGHLEVVELLLQKPVQLDLANNYGRTPLSCAAAAGHLEIVRLLLQRPIQLNPVDIHGMTPLQIARDTGHSKIVQLLLEQDGVAESSEKFPSRL